MTTVEITLDQIADYLGCYPEAINRFEVWASVVWVHRLGHKPSFISLRQFVARSNRLEKPVQLPANEILKETAKAILNVSDSSHSYAHIVKTRIAPIVKKLEEIGRLTRFEIYRLWASCAALESLGFAVPSESDLQTWLQGFKPSKFKGESKFNRGFANGNIALKDVLYRDDDHYYYS